MYPLTLLRSVWQRWNGIDFHQLLYLKREFYEINHLITITLTETGKLSDFNLLNYLQEIVDDVNNAI
jgi:hypothetical protein